MTLQSYLMINQSTNTVENVCVWNGDPNTWQPPAGYFMLVQDTTMALVWVLDSAVEDWVLSQLMGRGQIGFTWNGAECVTNEPKPEKPVQPTVEGAQTL